MTYDSGTSSNRNALIATKPKKKHVNKVFQVAGKCRFVGFDMGIYTYIHTYARLYKYLQQFAVSA